MATSLGPNLIDANLVFGYDTSDIANSFIGEPTTNLLLYTSSFIGTHWVGYCGPTSNVSFNVTEIVDPFGGYDALKVVRNNINTCGGAGAVAMGLLYSNPAGDFLISGRTYTMSFYARGRVGGELLRFGLNDSHASGYYLTLTTSWQRYSLTFYNISNVSRGFQFISDQANNDVYYLYGPQVELGYHATQYIPSGATQGTRSTTGSLKNIANNTPLISVSKGQFDVNANLAFRGSLRAVTMTIASPAVFTTSTAHGLILGQSVYFDTTGALPTGLTAGIFYYVTAIPTTTTFRISSILGGAADVNTSGTQSGAHRVFTPSVLYAGVGTDFAYPFHAIEFWVKSSGLSAGMVSGAGIIAFDFGRLVMINPNGTIYYVMAAGSGPANLLFEVSSTNTYIFDNVYHHVVCTRGSSTYEIYVDGVLKNTGSNGGQLTWNGTNLWSAMNVQIGDNPNNIFYKLNGELPYLRVYSNYMTAAQVTNNYNATRKRFGV